MASSAPLSPMRLGLFDIMQIDPIQVVDLPTMYQQRLDDLERIDDLGFDAAFIAERHFLPQFATASATAWLAAASQRTKRLRLGSMAYTLPMKSPVELAEDIATLDALSGGRLEVGFGMGHRVEELVAVGIDPNRRIPLFQERLALLKALLTGGSVTYDNGDIKLQQLALSPVPQQDPFPPLWFAGTEPTASQWMGANGLGLAVGFKQTNALIPAVSSFRIGRASLTEEAIAAEPTRPLGEVALMRSVIVGESDEIVREQVVDDLLRLEEFVAGEQSPATRSERRESAMQQMTEMLTREVMIAGSVETVATAIRKSRQQLGFDLFLASPYAMGATRERIATTLELLAGPVREQFAD